MSQTDRRVPASTPAPNAGPTDALQHLLQVMIAVRNGDFPVHMPFHLDALQGKPVDGRSPDRQHQASRLVVDQQHIDRRGPPDCSEQARQRDSLHESLNAANASLVQRNAELQAEIGERSRVEEQRRQRDKRKDEILATLAHELRNALAPLRNAINIRCMSNDPDPLQPLMGRQAALLVRLIDDLLDVASINLDKLPLKRAPTTVQALLDAALEDAAPLLEKGVSPLHLGNAANYSPPGQTVEVRVPTADGRVRTSIRDHGIGLTPEQGERLLELFNQVNTSIKRSHGGLGIGLALARKLVEMHGGFVEVQRDGLGQGSCFTVDLQLGQAPTPAAKPEPPALRPASGGRALVLDDNRDAADTLALLLKVFGWDVRTLYDPLEAADVVANFDPDLLFLDIGMPGLNGYDLARTLREADADRPRVLVAVTGWGQPEDHRRTAEAGFDHHMVKPPDLEELRDICNSVIPAEHVKP